MNFETTFNVDGMTCSSCVRHIDKALRQLEGVEEVEVSLTEKKVVVKHDRAKVTDEEINERLAEEGYASKTQR